MMDKSKDPKLANAPSLRGAADCLALLTILALGVSTIWFARAEQMEMLDAFQARSNQPVNDAPECTLQLPVGITSSR